MLTPVRAASNVSFSSNGQTAALATSGLERSVVVPVQAVEASDLNSAIAGKLNLLLIAAKQQMFEALLEAIEAASRALPLPRESDETDLVFASRLADAIQKLPPAKINEIERQLAAQGQNLPLRLIAEALKNPAGPEAGRIIAYLETLPYKDRDLAARAVVYSYHQNDASPLPGELRPKIRLQGESPPAASSRGPSVTAATSYPAGFSPVRQSAQLEKQPVENIDAVFDEPDTAESTEVRPQIEEKSLPEEPKAIVGERLASVGEEPVMAENSVADELPIDDLKDQRGPDEPNTTVREAQAGPLGSKEFAKSDSVIPKAWSSILASMTEKVSELVVAIIGEHNASVLSEDLAADHAPTAPVLEEAAAKEMPALPAEAAQAKNAQQAEAVVRPAGADAAALAREPKEIAAQPALALAELTEAAQKAGLVKPAEGFAYAQHPYHFAKHSSERKDGEMHRRDHEGSGSQNQHAPSGEQQPDAEADEAGSEGILPNLPEPEVAPAADTIADPIYALYQRMAGWE
ncbi:hypothetical protein HGP14_00130 [Rhizobium sp. P32RR-XVIII]|uniref:hypothetical protein n=1 Tax=Rhizobium sp. P32RR-XVIII TaxID=2726738 RepID=UPI001456E392|nr:hypothetical protein [Rhizobium sp. P32RR-XVIII]NLS01779.1 hypothetical protein [Rhizobium sp. P32RR-XVIII]